MGGRGPRKDVCDWWVLPRPGSSNGSLGKSLRRAKETGINREPRARRAAVVIQAQKPVLPEGRFQYGVESFEYTMLPFR